MRRVLGWLVAAVVATAVLVTVGVVVLGGSDDSTPVSGPAPSAATPTPTTLAAYDTSGVSLTRGPFCSGITAAQVRAALGADPATSRVWNAGDTVALGKGAPDVAGEYGCQYDGADGTVARAWSFAPPVTAQTAATLARAATKAKGCTPAGGPAFGSPTLALTCRGAGGTASASYRGLFGDAWVVCEVVRPAGATWDVADRAGRWCVGVLDAFRAAS